MAKKPSPWPLLLLVLFLGLLLGTVLGELGAQIAPWDGLRDFFAASVPVGVTGPVEVDLSVVRFVFGFTLKVNILGILGLLGAGLAYYRLSH